MEQSYGGGRGIRTPEPLTGLTVFKTAGFNHSPIPPREFFPRELLVFHVRDYHIFPASFVSSRGWCDSIYGALPILTGWIRLSRESRLCL